MAPEHGLHTCPRSPRLSLPPPPTGEVVIGATRASFHERDHALPALHHADELLSRSADDAPLAGQTSGETAALVSVARWAKEFLANPHPALGRSGHVCPYVSASLREQRFLLTMLRSAGTRQHETDQIMLGLAQYFLQLEPTAGRLAQRKTIVVLFPDLPEQQAADIIDQHHQRLKPQFLRKGLMLGEFYKESCKPGLHNAEFRPLRSDIPLLVIRAMVLTDIAFLGDEPRFIRAFLDNFGASGHAEALTYVERHRHSLPDEKISMLLEQLAHVGPVASESAAPAEPDRVG